MTLNEASNDPPVKHRPVVQKMPKVHMFAHCPQLLASEHRSTQALPQQVSTCLAPPLGAGHGLPPGAHRHCPPKQWVPTAQA
jgi:hypothetical protein